MKKAWLWLLLPVALLLHVHSLARLAPLEIDGDLFKAIVSFPQDGTQELHA